MEDVIDFFAWESSWEGENACSIFLRDSEKKKKKGSIKSGNCISDKVAQIPSSNQRDTTHTDSCEFILKDEKKTLNNIIENFIEKKFQTLREPDCNAQSNTNSNVESLVQIPAQSTELEDKNNISIENKSKNLDLKLLDSIITQETKARLEQSKVSEVLEIKPDGSEKKIPPHPLEILKLEESAVRKTSPDQQTSTTQQSNALEVTLPQKKYIQNHRNDTDIVFPYGEDMEHAQEINSIKVKSDGDDDEPLEIFDFTSTRGYFRFIKEEDICDTGTLIKTEKEILEHCDNNDNESVKYSVITRTNHCFKAECSSDFSNGDLEIGIMTCDDELTASEQCEEEGEKEGEGEEETDEDVSDDDSSHNDEDYVPGENKEPLSEDDVSTTDKKSKHKTHKRKKSKKKIPLKLLRRSGRIKDDKLKCKVCGYQSKTAFYLRVHNRIHNGEKPYECNQCSERFPRRCALREHLLNHSGAKPYRCEHCDKCFRSKQVLTEHVRVHTRERPHTCKVCDRRFAQRSSLNTHLLTHTNIKPFKCHLCRKRFRQKITLQNHVYMHTGEKPYACQHCEMRFSRSDSLLVHNRRHTNTMPYKCNICQRNFRQTSNLKRHQLTHTKIRDYRCTQCESAFSRKDQLDDHMLIHTGERPHKCSHCGDCFARKNTLRLHVRRHTGEKPYACPHCEWKFVDCGGLSKHMRRMHKDKVVPKVKKVTIEVNNDE